MDRVSGGSEHRQARAGEWTEQRYSWTDGLQAVLSPRLSFPAGMLLCVQLEKEEDPWPQISTASGSPPIKESEVKICTPPGSRHQAVGRKLLSLDREHSSQNC